MSAPKATELLRRRDCPLSADFVLYWVNGQRLVLSDNVALGCLRSLRAHLALDGVSWVQSGSVEIAVG